MKKKTNNSRKVPYVLSKTRTWSDFMDPNTLLNNPSQEAWRLRLATTMLLWAENPDSLEIQQFCMEYKIPRTSLYEWSKKYEDVGKAYRQMSLMIATRRRLGSMRKQLDGHYAYRDMHKLDPEWLDINEYHAGLKKDEDKVSHTFIINASKPEVTPRGPQEIKKTLSVCETTSGEDKEPTSTGEREDPC